MDATPEHFRNSNYSFPNVSKNYSFSEAISSYYPIDHAREKMFRYIFEQAIAITLLFICVFGAVGNGAVIWLLGFRIKRNPFMTYILNLAVADFGVLLSVIPYSICYVLIHGIAVDILFSLFLFTYSTSQFLLTAISIDRCVAIFFPIWHRCKRPQHLSPIVCTLAWILSILHTAMIIVFLFLSPHDIIGNAYQLIVNAAVCFPVMTTATVSLFIKVCLKQHRRGKLSTVVLLTLFFFLLVGFPYNILFIPFVRPYLSWYTLSCAFLLGNLNRGLNPITYFLVGRQRRSRRGESMKIILQKVFQEEEGCGEETPI